MNLVSVIQRILVQFGNVEKNELCFQFQESMNITDLMCLKIMSQLIFIYVNYINSQSIHSRHLPVQSKQ